MIPRRTLITATRVKGMGLFSGAASEVVFSPAVAGTGISFCRVGVPGTVVATVAALADAPAGIPARNTNIRAVPGGEILTIEHAMSALAGLGITDVVVEVTGPEVPIMDGSAEPFVRALWSAGLRYAGVDVEPLRILREVEVTGRDGAKIVARPRAAAGCSYTYELDYGAGGAIPAQSATLDTARTDASYTQDVAAARTFCTEAEAVAMAKAGLFKHLTARDMLVIGAKGPIDNTYRFENEPARHKLLDLIGDLALVGRPIQAEIVAHKAGHAMNQAMAKALLGSAV